MNHRIAISCVLVLLAACATKQERPPKLTEDNTSAPRQESADEPNTSTDEPASESEIDLGFDGEYSGVQVDATAEQPSESGEGEEERAKLGEVCNSRAKNVECEEGLRCDYTGRAKDAGGICVPGPANPDEN